MISKFVTERPCVWVKRRMFWAVRQAPLRSVKRSSPTGSTRKHNRLLSVSKLIFLIIFYARSLSFGEQIGTRATAKIKRTVRTGEPELEPCPRQEPLADLVAGLEAQTVLRNLTLARHSAGEFGLANGKSLGSGFVKSDLLKIETTFFSGKWSSLSFQPGFQPEPANLKQI